MSVFPFHIGEQSAFHIGEQSAFHIGEQSAFLSLILHVSIVMSSQMCQHFQYLQNQLQWYVNICFQSNPHKSKEKKKESTPMPKCIYKFTIILTHVMTLTYNLQVAFCVDGSSVVDSPTQVVSFVGLLQWSEVDHPKLAYNLNALAGYHWDLHRVFHLK